MGEPATIKFKTDTAQAQSGIKKLLSELNSFSKKIKESSPVKLAESFIAVGRAGQLAVQCIQS